MFPIRSSRLSSISSAAVVAAALLTAGTAGTAAAAPAPVDAVIMDPAIGPQTITFHSQSNPSDTILPVVFTPPTRDAFTKAAPLLLPCDVNFLAIGVSWKNITANQSLFVEWGGGVFENGSEKTKIPDGFGRSMVYIADGRSWQPGQVGQGGFIYLIEPPLLSWALGSFPANVPLRLQLETRGFTSNAYDHVRGGYALANLFVENVIWNNNYRVWVQRSCP